MTYSKRYIFLYYGICISAFLFCLIAGAFFYLMQEPIAIDMHENFTHMNGIGSTVYDIHGNALCSFSIDRTECVDLDELPPHVLNAFIAAEDHAFWTHGGFSLKGIVRSLCINLYYRKSVQGASTITQQLTKIMFFDSRKTLKRKVMELFYAIIIEYQYTKKQILQAYLNAVYFGAGVYGVAAAAKRFWQKSVSQLTIAEGALLAAIIKSPNRYCPLSNKEKDTEALLMRRNAILHSMYQCQFITKEQWEESKKEPLLLNPPGGLDGHLYEYIRIHAEKMIGKHALYRNGYAIYTTIDPEIQNKAATIFSERITYLRKALKKPVDGGVLCMEGANGQIRAIVGGYDFSQSQFNRAFYAKRQFGSIFKPIIYTAALLQGISFLHTKQDEPFSLVMHNQEWAPQNYTRTYEGTMTLAYALAHSNNIVTIKTLLHVGIDAVIRLAKKFHVPGTLVPYPSLALGCVDGTLSEALGMFNVFAQAGTYVEPHVISCIKDRYNHVVWMHKSVSENILPNAIIAQVNRVLQHSIAHLQRRYGAQMNTQSIGKTGTTNDCRTCWFCGATPTYTTAVYIGLDTNESMGKNVYPSNTAFPIWLALNQAIDHPYKKFIIDPSLKEIMIDLKQGTITSQSDPEGCRLLL